MKTNRDFLRATRAAGLLPILAWSLSVLGCSGSGGPCLNPQPLPPFCNENPQPLPPATLGPSGSLSAADGDAGNAAAPADGDAGNAAAPADADAGNAAAPPDRASPDGSGPDAPPEHDGRATSFDAGQCQWNDRLNDRGPGVCVVARAYVACTYAAGGGCVCVSDDPTRCPECGPTTGAVCKSMCGSNEYAVLCGRAPVLRADGGVGFDDRSVPGACTVVADTPAGNACACCPCE